MSDRPQLMISEAAMEVAVQNTIRHLRNKAPEQCRASLAHSDFTAIGGQAVPDLTWSKMYHNPPVDDRSLVELKQFDVQPVKFGGKVFRLSTYERTLLRAAGSTPTPAKPTIGGKKVDPVEMIAVSQLSDRSLADARETMAEIIGGDGYTDLDQLRLLVDAALKLSFINGVIGSLVNININGSIAGGVPGLNLYDGILKQIADAGTAATYSLSSTSYKSVVFPAMITKFAETATCNSALLENGDMAFFGPMTMLEKFIIEVSQSTTDLSGSYNPVTNEAKFGRCKVFGFRDWPTDKIILTPQSNLPLGIVNDPMKVKMEHFDYLGAVNYWSIPVNAHGVVISIPDVVYGS